MSRSISIDKLQICPVIGGCIKRMLVLLPRPVGKKGVMLIDHVYYDGWRLRIDTKENNQIRVFANDPDNRSILRTAWDLHVQLALRDDCAERLLPVLKRATVLDDLATI